MRGLFIPDITSEMFRQSSLEGIETLITEGEVYDIEHFNWIPTKSNMPRVGKDILVCDEDGDIYITWLRPDGSWGFFNNYVKIEDVVAWMPLPEAYRREKMQ